MNGAGCRLICAALLLASACPARAEDIGGGLAGQELVRFLRDEYRPRTALSYKQARKQMFSQIDNRNGQVRCVYTGREIATDGIPSEQIMNTEHTWPQSKFRRRLPMKSDLHHLFPTLTRVNGARGNLPFADIPDSDTKEWWRSEAPLSQAPKAGSRDEFSESVSSTFEPREDHKGNVARAMLYFWVVYGNDGISPSFLDSQLATLTRWHQEDPADAAERERSARIQAVQGNANPFVLDATLAQRIQGPSAALGRVAAAAQPVPAGAAPGPAAVGYTHRFPDFKLEYKPPEDQYRGPLFRLSQSYPITCPPNDTPTNAILAIPYDDNRVEQNWMKYLLAVREYCFKGNIDRDVDWQGQDNQVRKWYHVPWQHYGEKGREGIHGLTREASAKPMQLAPTQSSVHQTHAVAMYNARGGFTIGQVWQNQFEPRPDLSAFEPGAVVVKILFTQAKEDEVPYLKNPVVWQAYVQDPRDPTKRSVQNLRLLQMDVMVRDPRANATGGWTFGTYCYNGELANPNPWDNLVPVGLQWGNDPGVTGWRDNPTSLIPVARKNNPRLIQTIINESPDLPPQHLGWGGRLNGPADYFRSSCMSCHATAQYPVVAPQHPDFKPNLDYQPGSGQWMVWFRNLRCGDSFNPHAHSDKRATGTDFSLQLAIGIDNFYLWKSNVMSGYFTPVVPSRDSSPPPRSAVEGVETFRPTSESPEAAQR